MPEQPLPFFIDETPSSAHATQEQDGNPLTEDTTSDVIEQTAKMPRLRLPAPVLDTDAPSVSQSARNAQQAEVEFVEDELELTAKIPALSRRPLPLPIENQDTPLALSHVATTSEPMLPELLPDTLQTPAPATDRKAMQQPSLPLASTQQPSSHGMHENFSTYAPSTHEVADYTDFSEIDIYFVDLIAVEILTDTHIQTEDETRPTAEVRQAPADELRNRLAVIETENDEIHPESVIEAEETTAQETAIAVHDEPDTIVEVVKEEEDVDEQTPPVEQNAIPEPAQERAEQPEEDLISPSTLSSVDHPTDTPVIEDIINEPLPVSLLEETTTSLAEEQIDAFTDATASTEDSAAPIAEQLDEAPAAIPIVTATDTSEIPAKAEDDNVSDSIITPPIEAEGEASSDAPPIANVVTEPTLPISEAPQAQEEAQVHVEHTQIAVTEKREEEHEDEPIVVAETPRPLIHDEATDIPVTPAPVYQSYRPYQSTVPGTPQPDNGPIWQQWLTLTRPYWRPLVSVLLAGILLVNTLLLWTNLASPHLFLYALDPLNGTITSQQDLGSTQDGRSFTTPVYGSSTTFVGTHSSAGQDAQDLFSFNGTSLSTHTSIASSFGEQALSITPTGQLLIEGTQGLHVMNAQGQLLWQIQGAQPALGTHPFYPASDTQHIYTVESLAHEQVAAYDLQTGTRRWTQTLHDTLAYAPPFLLTGDTLYIASDHTIYALNKQNGSVRWHTSDVARTLLMNDATQGQLLAVGAQGVSAFDTTSGTRLWTFTGQPDSTLTTAQFYQATLANVSLQVTQPTQTTPVIYTTGIVWNMLQGREQVWLYAINATNGQPLWSQHIATSALSADAARTLQPLADMTHGLVIVQQQADGTSQQVTAYDAVKGTTRWQTIITGGNFAAHALIELPNGPVLLFTSIFSHTTTLFTFSLTRLFMLLLLLFSVLGLLAIWFYPLTTGRTRLLSLQKRFTAQLQQSNAQMRQMVYQARQQRLSRLGILAIALPVLACILALTYTFLSQTQQGVYQLNTTSGTALWQQTQSLPINVVGADSQGSVIVTQSADHLSQLQMRNSDGSIRWQLPVSEGTFSEPVTVPQNGNILLALTGPTQQLQQYAPADPAYPPTLAHTLMLSLLQRASGHVIWQNMVAAPAEQQSVSVLGADNSYIYVASMQNTNVAGTQQQVTQLFGVNVTNGNVDWHIFGPVEPTNIPYDHGTLLLQPHQAIWQVAGIVYALDTTVGQIEWRHPLTSDDPALLTHEETMAITGHTLLITRTDAVHALDVASGNELWTVPNPGPATVHSQAGVIVTGQTVLVYGNGVLNAFSSNDHHALWSQKQLGSVQGLQIAPDGALAYVAIMNSIDGGPPAPEIVAIDTQSGAIRWTYGLDTQATFASNNNFHYEQERLLVTLCIPSANNGCAEERLVALNAANGTLAWHVSGQSITDITLSADGTNVVYRSVSSPLIALLHTGA